ncbi:P-loop NTPase [Shewanella baltica]|uniref:P-loop NTPase n=1 Tax=Shewanella baltica TaxID=62322 RepID=UPI00217CEC61|nr:S1 RNA-binding domain-containing protein [Shewanella baltica]MCS6206087.1 S1 RNA-binding domain-containing protein [Shewanella baltica]
MDETKNTITSILSAYEQQEKRRALGGIYALAGFDYQLRFYLADFVESLANQGINLDAAGRVYLEALSDIAKQDANNHLVCIQVKRTLTVATLKDAASEVLAIDRFLKDHYPSMRDQVKFNLVASQGCPDIQWSHIPETHETHSIISQLLTRGQLLPPRIEPDPWWRAITATWPHLKDPFGFLHFALVRALSRGPTAADAQRVRDEICERFKQDQLAKGPPGQLLTPADFQLKEDPSTHLDVGREITLARLRDRQYMALTQRLNTLYVNLFEYKDISQRELRSEVQVFWLSGRSGAGKSVLLLQTLERLVCEGWRVLWLKGDAELLEPALRAIKETHEQDRPDFIAIDDLYDRDARNRIDLSRLGEFIDESDHQNWPIILTCGPTEFADSFQEDATYRGFNLNCYQIRPIAAQEAEEIEVWYQQRTCKPAQRGTAFTQAAEEDNGLFISLAVELAHGDLKTFAQRFARRVELNGLNKALLLPLALNRLYLRAPYDWLAREDREKLATLNHEGDFNLLETADEGQIVRLTHPHLANALYLALRKPANNEAYTNDLVDTFHRALTEQNANLVSQLLRLFSGREQGMAIDRLSIVKLPDLALKCAKHWHELPPVASDADSLADMATSWACWATTAPNITSTMETKVLSAALNSLEDAHKVWPICWQHLAKHYPKNEELFSWAVTHLSNPLFISHPTWSFVWEHCLQHDPNHSEIWHNIGLEWLQCSLRRPDWHIVWQKLLPKNSEPDWEHDPILILGRRRLRAEKDGPDWAFVLQDLLRFAPNSLTSIELVNLAHTWLTGREDRAEWAHVWRALLEQRNALPESLPLSELLQRGATWLTGREDRAEWSHVWRALLEQRNALPESLPLSELLQRGATWLTGREDRAEWSHVWQDLLEQRNALPESLPLSELLQRGATWLTGREDRAEWSYVWRALLEQRNALPESLPLSELLQRGATWLTGREDRAEWAHVWRALLEQRNALPESLPLSELLQRGATWLTGREDRAEWAHVWQDLLEQRNALPESLPLSELLQRGATWLTGREDRAEWAHVWQDLLEQRNALPESLPLSELLQRGATWLTGREDRAEWAHVWRALLEQRNALPESLPLSELLQRGATWLTGREDRAEWAHVWQALLEQRDALPESLPLSELLQRGATWLTGREDRADWAHVWQDLLELRGALPESLPLSELLQRGVTWLTEREDRAEEWGFVCERLLEQQYQDRNFFEIAANWLTQASEKPEWPLLSAKFIVAAPHHTASKKLAVTLAERIKVKPNSGNCLKTEELTADLAAKGDLPKEVNDWLQALRARKDHPAWAEVRRSFNEGLPIKGRTIRQQGSNAHTIELENGLLARYLISRNDRKLTKSDTCDFFVQQISPDRDFIQVGLNKAPQLKIGTKYDGLVREYKEYGVFVMVDGQQGLLHRSQYSNLLGLAKKFPTGSQVCVEIVALSDKGPQLRYAGPDLAAEVKAETLTIGQVYKACINGIQEYGLFLQIGVHSGLLHRTRLPPNTDILRQYAKGRQLDVQVVEIKDDGKLVFKLAEQ